MIEREYTVIANTREDLPALEAEITASSGAGPIPRRSVDIANPRLGSKIQTHFMLTDEEAEELRKDPRVRAVEIPPDQRTDIQIGLNATQTGTFTRSTTLDANTVNWGLRRCIETTNVYGAATAPPTNVYPYAIDGTGVDVVIQDSGIDPTHPEWNDYSGVTRLQQIDWYAASGLPGTQQAGFYDDYDGHGTHCAGIAAGLTYGWAKGARIYAQKLNGLEGVGDPGAGISIADAFDTIRLWHIAKSGTRPTVVNMSWGYSATITTDPTSGTHRGTSWTYGVDYVDRNTLWAATGVLPNVFGSFFSMPVRVASVDAEIEDMIDDGIHVCIAAGNNLHKVDVPAGVDYNNSVVFNGFTYNYHQGSSPYSERAFMVGNINTNTILDNTVNRDTTAQTTTRGPGVNIWAPGSGILSCSSQNYDTGKFTVAPYPGDNAYNVMNIGGTSMAAPQVAGVVAQHLQVFPNITPAKMQARIFNDSQSVLFSTGLDNDYTNFNNSLMGSPNRMLYSRYGVANPASTTAINFANGISYGV